MRRTGNPQPERLRGAMGNLEICGPRADGQFEFTAIAQYFDAVNDRLMLFRKGSFAKTITEGVPSGRVKINDAHSTRSKDTLGTVIEAEERTVGLWYRGLLSSTEAEIFTKMKEGHTDENSIEFHSVEESTTRVPLTSIPAGVHIWDRSTGDGTIEVRELLEVAWCGIAILPGSSQSRRALLETNCAVPFQDWPVAPAATSWDPDGAAERLKRWAGVHHRPDRVQVPNFAKLGRGFLLRGQPKNGAPQLLGQIVDVFDGRPMVVPEALDGALEHLASVRHVSAADGIAAHSLALQYRQKSERLANAGSSPVRSYSAEDTAGPAPDASGLLPPTEEASSDQREDHAAYELQGLELKIMSLKLLTLAAKYPEAADESTSTSRGPSYARPESF